MRETIILQRPAPSILITLPHTETFVARYERIRRQNLHRNVKVRRTRRAQEGGSFLVKWAWKTCKFRDEIWVKNYLFKKGLDVGSRAITSKIRKKLIDEGIKHAPDCIKSAPLKLK